MLLRCINSLDDGNSSSATLEFEIVYHANVLLRQPVAIAIMSADHPVARVVSLDHVVLTVKSIPETIAWYEKTLGMKSEGFRSAANPETTRYSLKFGSQKINLHQLGKVIPAWMLIKYPLKTRIRNSSQKRSMCRKEALTYASLQTMIFSKSINVSLTMASSWLTLAMSRQIEALC